MLLYVFEGIKGAGKDTLIEALSHTIASINRPVQISRDPGTTPLGILLYNLLHVDREIPVTDIAASYLYLAARAQLMSVHMKMDEQYDNLITLQNRWTPSTLAYQPKKFWPMAEDLDTMLPVKRVFWINTPPAEARRRVEARDGRAGDDRTQIFAHTRYMHLSETKPNWVTLDGVKSVQHNVSVVMGFIQGDISDAQI